MADEHRVQVRVKPSTARLLDESARRKIYEFNGQVYTLVYPGSLSVPREVATGWVAHDTDVEVVLEEAYPQE